MARKRGRKPLAQNAVSNVVVSFRLPAKAYAKLQKVVPPRTKLAHYVREVVLRLLECWESSEAWSPRDAQDAKRHGLSVIREPNARNIKQINPDGTETWDDELD